MEPFIGQIMPVGFNFAPRGWALCDGQLLPISSNTALFSLLGTTFGGDGRTTFALPDLRGRSMVGVGNGPGLSAIQWGQKGGAQTHQLSIAEMPAHTHNIGVNSAAGEEADPTGKHIAGITDGFAEDTTGNLAAPQTVGGSQAFSIQDPYLGIYMCIALQGIFPSRS
ncbi:tail fiber protein [Aureisphaera galaxeae]|uniref:phage tail protein n=1 Tax=Aureisphaera galaxeae TaxID=1538023 RepID=UPI0023500968|nr:tail fiber protein [Aureisphaera galaxeae]MDC8004526.1 tail fiber protein [Aureisphaera galaxeae]